MSWNDGIERKKFNKKLEKEIAEFKAAGMTDEQIQAIVDFDKKQYCSDRRYRMHTQELIESDFDDDEGGDNGKSPLYEKFSEQLTVTIDDDIDKSSPFSWIDEIKNLDMYNLISQMSYSEKELLTFIINGWKQEAIAKYYGITQPAVAKKIKKLKIIFAKWL